MAIDGTYNIEMDTPMGKMEQKFILTTKGNVLNAKVESQMGSQEATGKVDGNKFSWESDVESPMGKMHITCNGIVDGKNISGEIKVGDFGSTPFKGKKV